MLLCLPLFSFILFILFFRNKFSFLGWRLVYILSAVTLSFFAVIFIETASLFSNVTPSSVSAFWFAMTLVSAGLLRWSKPTNLFKLPSMPPLGIFEYIAFIGIVLILLINALVAFSFPPNNWDSMTYHLPRVMHWSINSSVHFYPTSIDRQLFSQPGAEFLLLHCFLLTGDDRWFNFLQWISLLGSAIGVSCIAGLLGAGTRGQLLSALFVTTLPTAILESTSTQNDLFVSFWVVAFVTLVLQYQQQSSRIIFYAASMALGLSTLAKATNLVVIPFIVYFFIILWKKEVARIFVCVGIVLLLITGHYIRSWEWNNQSSLISFQQYDILFKRNTPAAITINALFQIGSELMLPLDTANKSIEGSLQKTTVLLGLSTDYKNMYARKFTGLSDPSLVFHEDYAPNPLHLILIIALLLFLWRFKPEWKIWLYASAVLASSLLFAIIIKWNPWVTRLHLPLFMLSAPLVGVLIGRWKGLSVGISFVLLAAAVMVIIYHHSRPLSKLDLTLNSHRREYYFLPKPDSFSPYQTAARIILDAKCHDVGLIEDGDSWEYPLWAFTGFGAVRFQKLNDQKSPLPCMIVTIDKPQNKTLNLNKENFDLIWQQEPLQILKRQS